MGGQPTVIVGRHPSGWRIEIREAPPAAGAAGWRYAVRDPAGARAVPRLWGAPSARTLLTAKRHAVGEARAQMHEHLVPPGIIRKSWRWTVAPAPLAAGRGRA